MAPMKDDQPAILVTAQTLLPKSFYPSSRWDTPSYRVSGLCWRRGTAQIPCRIVVRNKTFSVRWGWLVGLRLKRPAG